MCAKKPCSPPELNMKITIQDVHKAKTVRGGYTGKQVDWMKLKSSNGKMSGLIGVEVGESEWLKFIDLGKKKQKKKNQKIINPVSKPDGWEWKPTDLPKPKVKKGKLAKSRERRNKKKQKVCRKADESFYVSKEWRSMRVRVLERYECKCMMCGRSPKDHDVVIHVDHIKPRSKHPELSLNFENLQLLCEDCNLGKSNKYETDWRPDIEQELDNEHLNTIRHLM